ncbi:MAG: hypothetical protein WEB53_07145 [Akkermansiaceae bacterium]
MSYHLNGFNQDRTPHRKDRVSGSHHGFAEAVETVKQFKAGLLGNVLPEHSSLSPQGVPGEPRNFEHGL